MFNGVVTKAEDQLKHVLILVAEGSFEKNMRLLPRCLRPLFQDECKGILT